MAENMNFWVIVAGMSLALLGIIAAFFFSLSRLNRSLDETRRQLEIERQRADQNCDRLSNTQDKLGRCEFRIEALQRRLDCLEIQPQGRSFDDAISMVERGASQDSLVSSFGLSPGEADLVTRMHRRRPEE